MPARWTAGTADGAFISLNRSSYKAISSLLDHNRASSFSGVDSFFSGPLITYCEQVLADLQTKQGFHVVRSYDDLCFYTQCFNVASLMQYLLGDLDRADTLARSAIEFVQRMADEANSSHWIVQIVQPAINVARLKRAIGDTNGCISILSALYEIVVLGKPAAVVDVEIDSLTASQMSSFDSKAYSVVKACYRTETLKCLLADKDFNKVRSLILNDSPNSQGLAELKEFELECLLKCELAERSFSKLIRDVSQLPSCRTWVYLYVVDAFAAAGDPKHAIETALALTERVRNHEAERTRDSLLYALALRLAHWALLGRLWKTPAISRRPSTTK
jgi:hypothetical protein